MEELLRESIDIPWTSLAAASMALAVVLGAFGAHALKKRVSGERLKLWETANRYHMVHALALVVVDVADLNNPNSWEQDAWFNLCGWLFLLGTLLFSGSLYGLTVSERSRWLGPLTPIGGLVWIAAWIGLAVLATETG